MRTEPGIRESDHFERLCSLLATLDDTHAGESGRLTFDGDAESVVLVQSGRVCWASSPGMPARLTDRIRTAATDSELRDALLQHNAETLLALAGHAAPRWIPSRVDDYDLELTFTSAELLAHSADAWWGPLAARAREELQTALGGSNAAGMAFLHAPDTADSIVPVAINGMAGVTAGKMLVIGRTAVALMHSCRPLHAHLVSTTMADGRTMVAWLQDGVCYVAFGEENSELAFVLAHLSRKEMPCPAGC